VRCDICRKSSIEEEIEPVCFISLCPTGFDGLMPEDMRILEIRGLLMSLNTMGLAGLICKEYGIDLEDIKILSVIETELREMQQPTHP